MYEQTEVSFGQACRFFWAFLWRFALVGGFFVIAGYVVVLFLSLPTLSNQAQAASMGLGILPYEHPMFPTLAIILFFFSGAVATRWVLGAEFGDFGVSVRPERRSAVPTTERHLHSNPLSRNPKTASLSGRPTRTTKIVYRD